MVLSQQKKKKSTKIRPKIITVVLLDGGCSHVPRGRKRQQLKEKGHIQKISVARNMSVLQIKNCIIRAFSGLPLTAYKVLKVSGEGHSLTEVSGDVEFNGEEIISIAGFGSLYLSKLQLDNDQQVNMQTIHGLN